MYVDFGVRKLVSHTERRKCVQYELQKKIGRVNSTAEVRSFALSFMFLFFQVGNLFDKTLFFNFFYISLKWFALIYCRRSVSNLKNNALKLL